MIRRSLRRRVLVLLVGVLALVMLLVAPVAYFSSVREVDELFDAELVESARLLADLQSVEGAGPRAPATQPAHPYERKLAFVIRDASGAVLARSHFADLTGYRGPCAGYADYDAGERNWRLFCLREDASGATVLVGQRIGIRAELERDILMADLIPFVVGVPLLAVLAWAAVGRALAPLTSLSGQVASRSGRNLDPVAPTEVPLEAAPLVEELNRLFLRVRQSIADEQRFTADAAHQLRTPLAAIRAQAEVAVRALPPGEAAEALGKVVRAVERAARLVDQLLALARLDHAVELQRAPVPVAALLGEVASRYRPAAEAGGLALVVEPVAAGSVLGDAELLGVALDNLVENALRHTPRGGRITLSGDHRHLTVTDSGPGIAPGERERVLQRFVRGADAPGPGSGLGLSIVARIGALHAGRFVLGDGPDGRGLSASLLFDAA